MKSDNRKSTVIASEVFCSLDKLTALWCLRALLPLGGHIEFMQSYSLSEEVLRAIGMAVPSDWDVDRDRKSFSKKMQKKLRQLEKGSPQPNSVLQQNIEWLSKVMHLSCPEKKIMMFAILLSSSKALGTCVGYLGGGSLCRTILILGELLHLPKVDVQHALSSKGVLVSSGLVNVEDGSHSRVYDNFQITLMTGFAQAMQTEHSGNPSDVFKNFFYRTKSGLLNATSYDHVKDEYALIRNYVSSARKNKTKGVNILIHGQPGTGKTELVRAVTEELDLSLYEISMEDGMGSPYNSRQRFSSYQLAQNIISKLEQAAILFDEIEDVFPCGTSTSSSDQLKLKAWTNRMLEENPVPSFWLSNRIDQIDQAYLRRFDLILELETPPMEVRHEILKQYFEDIPHNPDWIKKMSRMERLTPSHIEAAAKVMKHLPGENIEENERVLDKCLASKFKTLGIKKPVSMKMETSYRLDLLNSDYPLEQVVNGFKRQPEGRICLYGPPGTGKSAFAHHLSDALSMPVLAKKASDLLHPYVGGTEILISQMFSEAKSNQAILLLDEADSFLRDREKARASYEVSKVNELLVQMEEFEGIFICTTNLVDSLDAASMRRFDMKIMFDFLHPEQSWELFSQEFIQNMDETMTETARRKILGMGNLTPGDIALVKRQTRFLDSNIDSVIESLEKESQMKAERAGANKHIGFIN